MPSLPCTLAYFERRVEATYFPDDTTIELVVSAMVQPTHRVMRGLDSFVEGQCYEVTEVRTTTNPALLWERGLHARLRVMDECPDTEHVCKGARGLLLEELERKV